MAHRGNGNRWMQFPRFSNDPLMTLMLIILLHRILGVGVQRNAHQYKMLERLFAARLPKRSATSTRAIRVGTGATSIAARELRATYSRTGSSPESTTRIGIFCVGG